MERGGDWGGAVGAALRAICAVLVAGVLGAVAWCVAFAIGFDRDWSGHDYARAVGLISNHESGDASRRGFYITLGLGLIAALLVRLARRLIPDDAFGAAVAAGVAPFCAWAFAFGPWATGRSYEFVDGDRVDIPAGFLGLDGGAATPFFGLLAALAFGLVATRVVRFVEDPDWWRPGRSAHLSSLEFAEQGREQRDVGPGT